MSNMQILDLNISGIQCSQETDSSLQQVEDSEMNHIVGGGGYKYDKWDKKDYHKDYHKDYDDCCKDYSWYKCY